MSATPSLADVVAAFRARLVARGEGDDAQLVETHISLVLLAGAFAWKFKKPVDFGFVDFSTLERRRHFCEREVALNGRYAPGLYLGVDTIEELGVCEYAVRMRRFGADATLADSLARGAVTAAQLASFARSLAARHADAARGEVQLGDAAMARRQIEASVGAPLAPFLSAPQRDALAARLDAAMPLFTARHREGHVRDCHGDLHAGNVVSYAGELQAFDCIEFNDELRVIDTLSDAAFLLMDLDHRGAAALGHAFINAYLEQADDHAGLALLPLYCAYRALVRAKVALLRTAQGEASGVKVPDEVIRYLALAERYLAPSGRAGLVLTHGVSGSGKSHHARHLAAHAGFIHLRSDIERRRLAGLALDARSASAPAAGLYTAAMTAATYGRLLALARHALCAGYSVVVDATFIAAAERAPFLALAEELGAPLHILVCRASVEELRRRVTTRAMLGEDASEATLPVLERQLETIEALSPRESALAVRAEELGAELSALAALGRPRVA